MTKARSTPHGPPSSSLQSTHNAISVHEPLLKVFSHHNGKTSKTTILHAHVHVNPRPPGSQPSMKKYSDSPIPCGSNDVPSSILAPRRQPSIAINMPSNYHISSNILHPSQCQQKTENTLSLCPRLSNTTPNGRNASSPY